MAPRLTVAPYVGADEGPPIDIEPTEEAETSYQATEHVEQPPSPRTQPTRPKPKPAAAPRAIAPDPTPEAQPLVTSPSQLAVPSASEWFGIPWWVWAIGVYLVTKKRR